MKFDDFVSDNELESENRFWEFIADNFDHNEDTNTGANTTRAMGIISSEALKTESIISQTIKREDISSAKLVEACDNIKVYSKPIKPSQY